MRPRSNPLSLFVWCALALVGTLLGSACGGGDGTSTSGSISLSLSPPSGTVQQGGSLQIIGTITRSGGFTGNVTFATAGSIPAGLTGTVGNITTSGDVTTATIALSTTAATPAGTYPITVTGSGSGVSTTSATFALTVTAAPAGSYTLSLTPSALSIAPGASGTTTITITRSNFSGGVTLAAENLPSGVTATFNPASPVSGNSTALTLTVSASATVGTSTVTIRGTTPGQSPENPAMAIADQTVALALTITAGAGGGSYTLSANPATLSFAPGGNGTSTINISRSGGFTGNVALAVTGQPANLTATLAPASTTGNSSILTVTTTSAVAVGTYPLTITGASTGLANQTTTVVVTVAAAGGFTLSAGPAALSFAPGGGGTSTITITRTGGFAGNVALAVTGQPANLTATLNPTATTGNTATLTVTTTSAVAVGAFPLTITGSSPGLPNQTTTVAVTITGSGGGGNATVDFTNCAANAKAIWFAGWNGATWTRIVGVSDVYTFSVTSGRGGYAYVTQNGTNNTITVNYMTQAELTAGTIAICGTGTGSVGKTITGSVTGFGGGGFGSVFVSLGGAVASASSFAPNFTLNNVADGPNDLVAWRSDLVAGPSSADRGLLMRGLNPPNNSSLGTLDLAGGSSFAAATATAAITGIAGGDNVTATMGYATGAACRIGTLYSGPGTSSLSLFGVPAAQQAATDFHVLTVSAITGLTSFRTVVDVFKTLANRTIPLGPAIAATVTSLGGNYKRLQAATVLPAEYQSSASFTYSTQDGTRSVAITATFGYIGGANLTLGLDNFSGMPGWLDSYGPGSGSSVNWTLATAGFTNITSSLCAEGARLRTGAVTGTL
jgi:hypothetical protein